MGGAHRPWGCSPALAFDFDSVSPFARLATGVLKTARDDAMLVPKAKHRDRLPEHLNAPKRYRLETARQWLSRPSAALSLWCHHCGVSPELILDRSRKLLATRLRHEHQRRAQVIVVVSVTVC